MCLNLPTKETSEIDAKSTLTDANRMLTNAKPTLDRR